MEYLPKVKALFAGKGSGHTWFGQPAYQWDVRFHPIETAATGMVIL